MTNIIAFKPKAPVQPQIEPSEMYFTNRLVTALEIASYVHNDQEAVDLLLVELNRFFRQKISYDRLPEATVGRCLKYLEYSDEDLDASINYSFSIGS
jgi:hypothetical protein